MKATPILALFVTLVGGLSFPQSLRAQAVFENPQPGSFQSGVGRDFRLGVRRPAD